MNRWSFLLCSIAFGSWCGPVLAQPAASGCNDVATVEFGADGTATAQSIIDLPSISVADAQVMVVLEHAFVGDVTMSLTSPDAILVTLHSGGGGADDDIFVTYNDAGIVNGVPYNTGVHMQPSGPGTMADYDGTSAAGDWTMDLSDAFPTSGGGTLETWRIDLFDAAPASPPNAVTGLNCTQSGTDSVDMTWVNDAGGYDSIIVRDGCTVLATLGGGDTSYTATGLPNPSIVTLSVAGVLGGVEAYPTRCSVFLTTPPDVEMCSTPLAPVSGTLPPAVDTINVAAANPVNDLQFSVDITHTFQGDLTIDVVNPAMSAALLHSGQGGADDDIDAIYWTLGAANGSVPYNTGELIQPSGGPFELLSLFDGSPGTGDWTMTVTDTAVGDDGTWNEWCYRSFDAGPPFPISNLVCSSVSGSGVIDASWTNTSMYDEIGVFLDGIEVAVLPGTAAGFSTDPQPLPSTHTLCVEGRLGGIVTQQICCTLDLILDQPQALSCVPGATLGTVDCSWTNPGPYDAINVFVDGILEATIGGTDSSYTTLPNPGPLPIGTTICLEGVFGGGISAQTCCDALLVGIADSETCVAPATPFAVGTPAIEFINVPDALQIDDTEVLVGVTTTFQGDTDLTIESPAATLVQLHDNGGGANDDLNLLYSDNGIANGDPYNCFCAMQPSGPGVMADFTNENSLGDWVFTASTVVDPGTLNAVCVRIFEGCPTPPPSDVVCTAGELSWTNDAAYDGIEIVRDGVVIAMLPGTATSYTDTLPPAGTITYRVRSIDNTNMCSSDSDECTTIAGLGLDQCSETTPSPQFGDNGVATVQDTISVVDSFEIEDMNILVEITTAFVGDITMTSTSPDMVVVTLHAGGGGADDNLTVNYNDAGIPNAPPYDCGGCDMQPAGPGVMADYIGTTLPGDWVLDIEDGFPTSGGGTLDNWCVRVFGDNGGGPGFQLIRGDFDGSGSWNALVDSIFGLNAGFVPGSTQPPCLASADADGNGSVNFLVDSIYNLNAGFVMGSPLPPAPWPDCGNPTATDDAIGCATPGCP